MSAPSLSENEQKALLRRAARWRLVALLLECPREGWGEQLAGLTSEARDRQLAKAVRWARREASVELYHTTFGPGGPARVREVACGDWVQPGLRIARLLGLYEAFGYRPALSEPPDHVAVEAGFVAYLHLKACYAMTQGRPPEAELALQTARSFALEHLSRFAESLAEQLSTGPVRYLRLAGEALRRRVRLEHAAPAARGTRRDCREAR